MRPSFNTAGPCIRGEHYMLPPERRLSDAMELIEEHKFFTLTAGRQTGKTTSLMWLEEHYNQTGQWRALWVDIQTAREEPDPAKAFRTVLGKLDKTCARTHPDINRPDIEDLLRDPKSAFGEYLACLAAQDQRPWVFLFDEVDGLVGESMVSFLTQLRDGYVDRAKRPFPASVVLVGQRQVRDYSLREEERRILSWLGTTSPFNITAEGLTIVPFKEAEVGELLLQHTTQTGQVFQPEAIAKIYDLGQGHPWLTNAMADQIVRRDVKDRSVSVTEAHVEAAKETIILERRTHIDSLIARLREDRVRRIIDPMMAGQQTGLDVLDDDFAYVRGLGLVRLHKGMYEIANPIYREVIPRALNYDRQMQIWTEPAWYVRPDGLLDMGKLMNDWQTFWRKDGHLAARGFGYRESGPHLMLMAFLQRIINGGGRIEREYGLGRGALDLAIHWNDRCYAIEVILRRDAESEADGIAQLSGYLDKLGLAEGWLVIFDRRKKLDWKDKIFQREAEFEGKCIHVIGC
ncbi:MAG TPA: AAA-like domain-containing protein [Polyangium sp.]|nr:AAA-like domain-containing protein [Polyangium sp.]